MTRSEMREEVASEENNLALLKRDLPMIEETLRRARGFRELVAEHHCASYGDAIDTFLGKFDDAYSELRGEYCRLMGD